LRRSEEAANIKQESEPRQGGQWFNLDWILSFFVSLDDQISRISRMKASIFFVILPGRDRGSAPGKFR